MSIHQGRNPRKHFPGGIQGKITHKQLSAIRLLFLNLCETKKLLAIYECAYNLIKQINKRVRLPIYFAGRSVYGQSNRLWEDLFKHGVYVSRHVEYLDG